VAIHKIYKRARAVGLFDDRFDIDFPKLRPKSVGIEIVLL